MKKVKISFKKVDRLLEEEKKQKEQKRIEHNFNLYTPIYEEMVKYKDAIGSINAEFFFEFADIMYETIDYLKRRLEDEDK